MAPPLAPTQADTSHPTTISKGFLYPMLLCGQDVCLAVVQTLGWLMRHCCPKCLLVTWLLLLNHCHVQQTTNTPSIISYISKNRYNNTLGSRRHQLWDPGIVVRVRGCALPCPTQAVAFVESLTLSAEVARGRKTRPLEAITVTSVIVQASLPSRLNAQRYCHRPRNNHLYSQLNTSSTTPNLVVLPIRGIRQGSSISPQVLQALVVESELELSTQSPSRPKIPSTIRRQ